MFPRGRRAINHLGAGRDGSGQPTDLFYFSYSARTGLPQLARCPNLDRVLPRRAPSCASWSRVTAHEWFFKLASESDTSVHVPAQKTSSPVSPHSRLAKQLERLNNAVNVLLKPCYKGSATCSQLSVVGIRTCLLCLAPPSPCCTSAQGEAAVGATGGASRLWRSKLGPKRGRRSRAPPKAAARRFRTSRTARTPFPRP